MQNTNPKDESMVTDSDFISESQPEEYNASLNEEKRNTVNHGHQSATSIKVENSNSFLPKGFTSAKVTGMNTGKRHSQCFSTQFGQLLKLSHKPFLSEFDFVTNVSDGLLLKGICLQDLTHFKKRREILLKVREGVKWQFPWKAPLRYEEEFQMHGEYENFKQRLPMFGISNSMYLPFDLNDSNTFSITKNCKCRICQSCAKKLPEFEIRASFLPFHSAAWQPRIHDFSLSENAIEHLKTIERALLKNAAQEAKESCRNFFDMFGTHFIIGQVHFGRIAVNREKKVDKLLHGYSKASQYSNSHKSTEHCHCNKNESHCYIEDNYSIGDDHCNRDWVITDREVFNRNNIVGVWRLILQNKHTFTNNNRLADFVKDQTEKEHSEAIEFKGFEKHTLHVTLHKLHDAFQSVSDPDSHLQVLKHIVHEISRLEHESSWLVILENCSKVSLLFGSICELLPSSPNQIEIRRYMRQILLGCGDISFAHRDRWENLLEESIPGEEPEQYPEIFVSSLWHFFQLLEKKEFLKCAERKESEKDIAQYTSITFILTTKLFLSKLKSKWHLGDYAFLIATLMPFQYDFKAESFSQQMSQEVLSKIYEERIDFLKTYEEYCRYGMKQQHAWVVRLLVSEIIKLRANGKSLLNELPEEFVSGDIRFHVDIVMILKQEKTLAGVRNALSKVLQNIEKNNTLTWDTLNLDMVNSSLSKENRHKEGCAPLKLRRPLKYLLEEMEITEYFPEKLSIQMIQRIDVNKFKSPTTMANVPWAMIQQLLTSNSRFIEHCFKEIKPQWKEMDPGEKNDFEKEKNENKDVAEDEENNLIHPFDIVYALLLCCDPFLKLKIYKKLIQLQTATPLIYRDSAQCLSFPIWQLKNIFIDDGHESLVSKSFHTVTFIKIGNDFSESKSATINRLIRDDLHETFFHRDCFLGENERKLYNGVIELSWNSPIQSPETEENKLNSLKPCAILNLRGDSLQYPEELAILEEMSNTVVIFIGSDVIGNEKSLKTFKYFQNIGGFLALPLNHSEELRTFVTKFFLPDRFEILNVSKKRHFSTSKLREILVRKINDSINNFKGCTNNLESIANALSEKRKIKIDEERYENSSGISQATSFIRMLNLEPEDSPVKETVLPLHGHNFLHQWTSLQRKLKQAGISQLEAQELDLEEEMSNIRVQQAKTCVSQLHSMSRFISILLINGEETNRTLFFLYKLNEVLEKRSRKIIPRLSKQLTASYRFAAKKNTPSIDMSKTDDKLEAFNFSVIHFFREISQIYESFHHCKYTRGMEMDTSTWSSICLLPRIIAQLLISGRPFEVMDGDSIDISVNWINAVFQEIINILGDRKMYAVSVLGNQSSGKSTLLNTMFGLDFPVRVGRCTRGVSLHLLPTKLNGHRYEYVFVFDTEGLRSSVNDGKRQDYDNKLATFAIGIADTVVINIMGENLTDMEDTLQIVVHALMRLQQANNKVKLLQSCVFVHQNVHVKKDHFGLQLDKEKVRARLNDITKHIATHEHISKISSFCDVILFEPESDVFYVPNLWQGIPPMALISSGYRSMVGEIEKHLLQICSLRQDPLYSISDMLDRIEYMWAGILSENFIFSFQNVLQVKGYNLLQRKVNEICWQLEKYSSIFWRKNVRRMLHISTLENIEDNESKLRLTFERKMNILVKEKTEILDKFCEENNRSAVNQWQETKKQAIIQTSESIKRDFNRKLSRRIMQIKIKFKTTDSMTEEDILRKTVECARKVQKSKMPTMEDFYKENFDKFWQNLSSNVVPVARYESQSTKQKQLLDGIVNVLDSEFEDKQNTLKRELNSSGMPTTCHDTQNDLQVTLNDIRDTDINVKKTHSSAKNLLKRSVHVDKYRKDGLQCTRKLLKDVSDYFRNEEKEDMEYDEKDFKNDVLSPLMKGFDLYNSENTEFSLKPDLQIKIAVKVAKVTFAKFSEMNKRFEEKHDLYAFVKSKEALAKQVFYDVIQEKKDISIVVDFICRSLRSQVERNILTHLSDFLEMKILDESSFLKSNLLVEILKALAESDDFNDFLNYVKDPKIFAKKMIQRKATRIVSSIESSGQPTYRQCLMNALSREMLTIKQVAEEAAKNTKSKSLHDYINNFSSRLDDYEVDHQCMSLMSKHTVSDLELFYELFMDKISEIENELCNIYKKQELEKIEWKQDPFQNVLKSLWGCRERCPWCYEPCINNREDHITRDKVLHSCLQHKPLGLRQMGITFKRNSLALESCNYSVRNNTQIQCGNWCGCSNMCKSDHSASKYKEWMGDWNIPAERRTTESAFWCWFTVKNYFDIENSFGCIQSAGIPSQWRRISKERAISSLDGKQLDSSEFSFMEKLQNIVFRFTSYFRGNPEL